MKKTCLLTIFALLATFCAFADNIQRPNTFNYQSGVDAFTAQDYDKSLDFMQKELLDNPKNGYAHLYESLIYDQYSKYGDAMTAVNNAIKYIPKKDKEWLASCYNHRANMQAELGDSASALADYATAYKIDKDVSYLYGQSNIYYGKGDYTNDAAVLAQAVTLDPNNATTRVYVGRNEEIKGNIDKALESYSYAIKLDPTLVPAFSFRASTYFNQHMYKESCQDAISALSLGFDQSSYTLLYNLADSAMMQLTTQLKAQQLKDPNDPQWAYYLGLMKEYKDDTEGSIQPLKDAARIQEQGGGNCLLIYQNLSENLCELGHSAEAMDYNDKALLCDSTDERTWFGRAAIYRSMYKLPESTSCISKAIELSPEDSGIYAYRARNYMYDKQFDKALEDANNTILLNPEASDSYHLRGEVYTAMNKKTEAEADLKKTLEMETALSSDMQDKETLASTYARLGDKKSFYAIIDSVYTKNTKNNEYNLCCMYSLIGDTDNALAHLEKSLKMGYASFALIDYDYDLNNIRQLPKFQELVNTYRQKCNDTTASDNSDDGEYEETVTEVPFVKESGICKVKCTINDLPLYYYFDTGAADVTLSSVEAAFMLKNDYLKTSDIKGTSYYGDANGDLSEGTVILLKKIDFGGLELNNVRASIVHNQRAPLLLGQTALSRLGKIEIDYSKKVIKITSRKRK